MDFKMITDLASVMMNHPPNACGPKCSHQLWIGDQLLALSPMRTALVLFRDLSGNGIPAEQFPMYLRGVSQELFGDPEAIDVGTPLKYIRSNGEVQLAAAVGSAFVRLPVEALELA